MSATVIESRTAGGRTRFESYINTAVAGALIAAPALAARSGAVVLGQLVALAGLSAVAFVLRLRWRRAMPPKLR
jgi:membrane associated rhomboid family serine protease